MDKFCNGLLAILRILDNNLIAILFMSILSMPFFNQKTISSSQGCKWCAARIPNSLGKSF